MSFPVSGLLDSNKAEAVFKRSQAYILIKHGYSVRGTAQLIGKLRFLSGSGQNVGRIGHLRGTKRQRRPAKISSKISNYLVQALSIDKKIQKKAKTFRTYSEPLYEGRFFMFVER